ncbi:uncharacterized protein AMSG_00844 [Thecamonas trahens ATCC 50062]|uniref:Heparan-alpha-glucosaminide N-acetyltransferase catalytic domain-containing protein n=1 Tax=Thecamonas trahens ATCC 50062 TaxID=461836 RepID=A0A0L0DEW9_THETB|nr:hypothetical protein AMSG_00844 [Thecamonas trahens ATCC 50062]KNC50686.1 hypothetical protein AMSG_00844 [Thecamonas trahens ATCC 50062]|eukprot:XP_013762563.1 hypothetical protein AMSG_00844 [Thecamonas trahens ATCC 50062]
MMMMIDNQGSPQHVWWPFHETVWNGLGTADFIFPFFLFIMGSAVAMALKRAAWSASPVGVCRDRAVWIKVARRSVALFGLGLLANLQGTNFEFGKLRIMGVLQRLGLCYGLVAVLYLTLPPLGQRIAVVLGAGLYLVIMYAVDVPDGCGDGKLTPYCNGGAYIDRSVFGRSNMMWPNDPEGLTSTLTATVTTFAGLELGRILVNAPRAPAHMLPRDAQSFVHMQAKMVAVAWAALSLMAVVISLALLPVMQFSKKRYTVNFALMTAGCGGLLLAGLYAAMDMPGFQRAPLVVAARKLGQPLVWIGCNPLAVFLGMLELELVLMDNVKVSLNGERVSLWHWLYVKAFASWMSPSLASSAMAGAVLALWWLVAWIMYRRQWFLKL